MPQFQTITKFQQFADYLEQRVRSGKLAPGSRLPSERDLARAHGLSHMTVNKAVANLVSRQLLRRSHGNGTYVVGPQPDDQSTRTVVSVIEADPVNHPLFLFHLPIALQDSGLVPVVLNMMSPGVGEQLTHVLAGRPRALIADAPSLFPFAALGDLAPSVQTIFIHRFEGQRRAGASYILSDYRAGGYLAVRHLLDQGRRRILLVSFEIRPGWTSDLYHQGALRAFADAGIEPAGYVNSTTATSADYARLFSSRAGPDGVAGFGDARLLPVRDACRQLGLRIPDDVAFVGYNDTPWAEVNGWPSVSIRPDEISRRAVEALGASDPVEVVVAPVLHDRNPNPPSPQTRRTRRTHRKGNAPCAS